MNVGITKRVWGLSVLLRIFRTHRSTVDNLGMGKEDPDSQDPLKMSVGMCITLGTGEVRSGLVR